MTGKVFGLLLVLLAVHRNYSHKTGYDPYAFYTHKNYSYTYSYDYGIHNNQPPFRPPTPRFQGPAHFNPYGPPSGDFGLEDLSKHREGKQEYGFGNPEEEYVHFPTDDDAESSVHRGIEDQQMPLQGKEDAQDSLPAGSHFQQARHAATAAIPNSRANNDAIIYPQNHHVQTRNSINLTGANCIFGLCEEVADYPFEKLRNLLNRTRAFDAFNVTQVDLESKFTGAENVCDTIVNTTFPRFAINTEQKKRYIANLDQFKQGIRTETCNGGGQHKCKFSESWPLNYQSVCEQKFTVTLLLALDDDSNPVVESFQTPSNCVCMYIAA